MSTKPQTLDRDFLTVKQAASYLQVNAQTVRRMILEGKLSATKLGSGPNAHLRISTISIEKLLESNRH